MIKLMLIGESPSRTRPKGLENIAFSGKTSYILWNELKEYGITRKNCITTNIVEEVCEKNELYKKALKLENLNRLKNLITNTNPDCIIVFGSFARKIFNENILEKNIKDKVFYCIHHSAVARNPKLKTVFVESLYNAIRNTFEHSIVNING